MPEKLARRVIVQTNIDTVISELNKALQGEGLDQLKPILERLGRGNKAPHWYLELEQHQTLPNLDGKTIGSILEMLLVAVLESHFFSAQGLELKVNPARGVDLPDLNLGVKSPSANYCTSEPFFSAYERLFGNEYDCIILLTDYQTAKKTKGKFQIKIDKWKYLKGSEIADQELCRIARENREWLIAKSEAEAKRVFRFLAYANQSDWRCRQLIKLLDKIQGSDEEFDKEEQRISSDYTRHNKAKTKASKELIPEADLNFLSEVFKATPRHVGLINQLDNWVTDFLKDASRSPNSNEWERLLRSPLDGKIGMSFALQWRYNFGQLFNAPDAIKESAEIRIVSEPQESVVADDA